MKCPLYSRACSKYNTVRHCPGCPLWQKAKEARQARMAQSLQQANQRNQEQLPPAQAQAQETRSQAQSQTRTQSQAQSQTLAAGTRPQSQSNHTGERAGTTQQQSGGWRLHAEPVNKIYLYDGSLAGFYTCVYESVYMRESPAEIRSQPDAQPTLLTVKEIVSDQDKARKVRASIQADISKDALDLTETVYYSCLEQKELRMLRFLLFAYREGAKTLRMLGHPDVAPLLDAEKHLYKEAHLLKGFVRFSDYDGVLAANITPKNFILPFLANHFCMRYAQERFIIYDKTHKAGLIYQNKTRSIIHLETMPFPQADEDEERYRMLWKNFYHTIAIEARTNPKLRMTNMPKRYWENMTEMKDLL